MKAFIFKSSALRSGLLVALSLIIGFCTALITYAAYCNQESKLKYDDVVKTELVIDENGDFIGKFRTEKTGRSISGIKYKVKDGNLYITVLATMGEKKALPTDEDGYAVLTVSDLPEINEVFYRTKNKDESLSVVRR